APAACAPPALSPPAAPAARLRPACRPLQPSCCLLQPVRRPLQPAHCPLAAHSLPPLRCPAPAHPAYCSAMASLRVLAFDHEGRPIQFDTWLDDLQLYLLSDSRDNVSLFDHPSGATPAPLATADSATRSQWLTCDAAARLAIRNHLPLAKCTHFGQHRTAQALYDDVVARYSSPAMAALGRLLIPYLFPELSVFATVEDLVTHLCTSDARYRARSSLGVLSLEPLSLQQLREWFAQRTHLRSGAAGAGVSTAGDTGAGGAGVTAGARGTGGAAAAGPGGARTKGTRAVGSGGVGGAGAGGAGAGVPAEPGGAGAGGTGAGGAGAGGAGAGDTGAVGAGAGRTGAGGAGAGGVGAGDTGTVDPGAGGAGFGGAVSDGTGAGGTVRSRPFFVPLLQQVLGLPSSTGLTPPLLCPPPGLSQPLLQPASPLPAPSPYTELTEGPTEHHEPESRPASLVCAVRTGRRVPRP
ncbi:unnamed protein product, partial [Closterium sp. NIES-54]